MDGDKKTFRMIDIGGNHVGIELERAKNGEEILYTKGKEEELDTFKAIRRVHQVTNHKSVEQLVIAYRKAGSMGPGTGK